MYTSELMEKKITPKRSLLTLKEMQKKKKKSERNILFDFMGAQTSSQSNKIRKEKKKA